MKKLILPLLSLIILVSNADGRLWTNQKGQSFEGELVEVKDSAVTIRRASDRIKFTLDIKELSQADQDHLTKLAEEKKIKEEKERKSSDDYIPLSSRLRRRYRLAELKTCPAELLSKWMHTRGLIV